MRRGVAPVLHDARVLAAREGAAVPRARRCGCLPGRRTVYFRPR